MNTPTAKNAQIILIVSTSASTMTCGKPTGVWLEEYAIPFLKFKQAGYRIEVASPAGGQVPIDPASLREGTDGWSEAIRQLETSTALASLKADAYVALFIPGGHGAMFDLATDPALKRLLQEFAAQQKVIASVCHGPAGFVGATKPDGTALVAGRKLTSFTDQEEKAAGHTGDVPFALETRLREEGAKFIAAENWATHVEVDDNLITGQNPASSALIADTILLRLNHS